MIFVAIDVENESLIFENLGMEVAVKYSYVVGPDWQVAAGLQEGFSQVLQLTVQISKFYNFSVACFLIFFQLVFSGNSEFVLNLPLDCTFRSTNPHGWPRLVIELVGPNNFGQDQPRGFW